jgi:hypothetical protein
MVQTLDDMLSERQNAHEKIAVWLRIGRELPMNIVEEHINNLEEMRMNTLLKNSNKRVGILIGTVVIILGVGVGVGIMLHHNEPYSPTTFARLQSASSRPVCLEKHNNTNLKVDSKDNYYIGNVIATSVTDALAGTNVNVYFKTFDGSNATGTAAYSSYYGSYNFTVKKTASNATNNFVGGWSVTRFQACKT